MTSFWAVVNGIVVFGLIALLVFLVIYLIKLNKRMAKIEELMLELKKGGKNSP